MKWSQKADFRTGVLIFLAAMGAAILVLKAREGRSDSQDMALLGLKEFVQSEITYDGVMHELYWHYEFTNQMIRLGRVDDAKAHLKMLTFYVNLLPYLTREKKFFKDPSAVKKFDTYAQDLIRISGEIENKLGKDNPELLGKEMEKKVAYICYHCHKDLKTPIRDITPYGKKIEMGPGRAGRTGE